MFQKIILYFHMWFPVVTRFLETKEITGNLLLRFITLGYSLSERSEVFENHLVFLQAQLTSDSIARAW